MTLCGKPESIERVLTLYLHHLVVQVSVNLKCEAHVSQNETRQGSLLAFSNWLVTVKVQAEIGFILVLKLFSLPEF
jgi:hypothetical protein